MEGGDPGGFVEISKRRSGKRLLRKVDAWIVLNGYSVLLEKLFQLLLAPTELA
jgi:hypothetical protein